MPEFSGRPLGLRDALTLACLAMGLLYVFFVHPWTVALVLALLLLGALCARHAAHQQAHQLRQLAASRPNESICDFARAFDLREVDSWIVRAVYEQVQAQLHQVHPQFPLRASDRLMADLQLDADDIDLDLAPQIEQRTGRSLDRAERNPLFGKVITLGDLVRFFQGQAPQRQVQAS
ncbi:hypothetical protein HNQ51_000415 [Inhella inkyongensis]|uniref:Uncharacterized protein n=1 Tax=Inhella inkyongensis TaxID=392593 RepID=A0A840S0T1_9BURK|nr:hypothetical protein [Inhella inkyongensis]MBB5203122.1 hypothetical protein [Inhella inkyongensis]